MRRLRVLALALFALLPAFVRAAADDADASALQLADEVPAAPPAAARDWRSFVEGAAGRAYLRRPGGAEARQRLAVDVQLERALTPAWRAVLAERLDLGWPAADGRDVAINTLKEAYLGWREADLLVDGGRINVRSGVAQGYNPTDYFRRGALRTVISPSPASLRENRQGSFMLRGQTLWDGGALTGVYSPGLARRANPEGLVLDVGATNDRQRGLIALSQRIAGLAPQFLLYGEEGRPPQWGLNLSGLLGDATVLHAEWSGGRTPAQLGEALDERAENRWRKQLAAGFTHTLPFKLSLTAEAHYNGGGLERGAWQALRNGPPARYLAYRNWAHAAQEMPTRRALFFYGVWEDALVRHLDLRVLHHVDLVDGSRRSWLELLHHDGNLEYALQWLGNRGSALSDFGALPEARSWQLLLRQYF